MPRIRTVKPEFFEDEDVGILSREARLLFVGTWTLADDEGLLRWTAPYLKAAIFMYDDDLTAKKVATVMDELAEAQMVLPYRAGKSKQQLGWIINFRKHQRINRPQPGKLPPPCLQMETVRDAYLRRDEFRCALCGEQIETARVGKAHVQKLIPSLDHIVPRSKGGTDYPTNIRAVHFGCNARRGNRSEDDAVSDSLNASPQEGKGMEGKRKGMESDSGNDFSIYDSKTIVDPGAGR